MKKLIKFIISLGIILFLVWASYKFFFACEEQYADFGHKFILKGYDYAKVGDELTVKLINIKDDRCLDESCEREGQFIVKLLIKDDHHIVIEKLGSVGESKKDLTKHKLNYSIELTHTDGKEVSLEVNKLK